MKKRNVIFILAALTLGSSPVVQLQDLSFASTAVKVSNTYTYEEWSKQLAELKKSTVSHAWPAEEKTLKNTSLTYEDLIKLIMRVRGDQIYSEEKLLHEAYDLGLLQNVIIPAIGVKINKIDAEQLILNMKTVHLKGKDYSLEEYLDLKPYKVRNQEALKVFGLKRVEWIQNNVLEIIFAKAPERLVAGEIIVNGGVVKSVEKKSSLRYEVLVEGLSYDKVYKVTVGNSVDVKTPEKANEAVWLIPIVSYAKNNETIQLKFSKLLTEAALDVKNFTIEKNLKLLSANFAEREDGSIDRSIVVLKTENQKYGELYQLKLSNTIKDYLGNGILIEKNSNILKFGGVKKDDVGPTISSVIANSNNSIQVEFEDASDLSQLEAQTLSNYKVIDVSAGKVVAVKNAVLKESSLKTKTTVILETESLEYGKTYLLEVSKVKDIFGNEISTFEDFRKGFLSKVNDQVAPHLIVAEGINLNLIKLIFDEAISPESVSNVENFVFQKAISPVNVWISPFDNKVVYLETTAQTIGVTSSLTVNNISDLSGNMISSGRNRINFYARATSGESAVVLSLNNIVEQDRNMLIVNYNRPVNEVQALTASNYDFGALGKGIYVYKLSDTTYKVLTPFQDKTTRYNLYIYKVEDQDGNVIDMEKSQKVFYGNLIKLD